ncbi:unnamed protein product [Meganyctiphanes norvegica]|uniref:Uncharacterized protein n=1 Tax=Meganyctiphanes norvegica TaxID=48144 RepID=A0AAV2Q164_MEGNR
MFKDTFLENGIGCYITVACDFTNDYHKKYHQYGTDIVYQYSLYCNKEEQHAIYGHFLKRNFIINFISKQISKYLNSKHFRCIIYSLFSYLIMFHFLYVIDMCNFFCLEFKRIFFVMFCYMDTLVKKEVGNDLLQELL